MEEFQSMVTYFGETEVKKVSAGEIFGIFAEFISKFEVRSKSYLEYY